MNIPVDPGHPRTSTMQLALQHMTDNPDVKHIAIHTHANGSQQIHNSRRAYPGGLHPGSCITGICLSRDITLSDCWNNRYESRNAPCHGVRMTAAKRCMYPLTSAATCDSPHRDALLSCTRLGTAAEGTEGRIWRCKVASLKECHCIYHACHLSASGYSCICSGKAAFGEPRPAT